VTDSKLNCYKTAPQELSISGGSHYVVNYRFGYEVGTRYKNPPSVVLKPD